MTGKTVLHYEIGEQIGAGGMGEVYRARDTRLGRQVALKFINPQHQQDPDHRARLLKEARAAAMLRSPAIATTYDIGEHEGPLFLVMELVEGELLSDHLQRGPLSVSQVVDLGLQVADALDEAHTMHMVHRDIKSANLILTRRGLVKMLDFGLAKFTGPTSPADAGGPTIAQTQLGTVVGTVSYMSPEQALGRPVDHRSDLFSLGIVLYETLTGRLPFEGDTLTAVVDAILHQEPPALARFNYEVPSHLDTIVRKMLEKDPSLRYQSARDLVVDLRAVRRGLDAQSRHSTTGPLSALGSAAVAAEVAPRNAVAVIPFSNITREPTDDWIGAGIAETVTGDLKTIRGLSVIGRERIFDALRHLGTAELTDPDERFTIAIGRQLRATWLVSGSYQRLGDVIRITARFVDVSTGTIIRTVKIDGAIRDIFALQDKIVYELSQGLNLTLHDTEVAEIERQETASVEAYENRSRAMMNLLESTPQALDRAIYLLEKATAADANYAAAWAALGTAYDLKGSFLSISELSQKAIEVERWAIRLNPKLADAHRSLGSAFMALGQFDEAIDATEEALRLEPDDASTHSALGRAYWVGKGVIDEGIRELEQATAINPDLGYAHLQLGHLYALRGHYVKAEAACGCTSPKWHG